LATAKRFVEEGAYVFITGRRQKAARRGREAIARMFLEFRETLPGWLTLIVCRDRRPGEGRIDIGVSPAGVGEFAPWGCHRRHFDQTIQRQRQGRVHGGKSLPLLNDVLNHSHGSVASGKARPPFGVYAAE